jgi:small subunit ribosomal protein S9
MADPKKIISSAIGRRREAVASVRLIPAGEEMIVNGKPISVYFPGLQAKNRYELPLKIVDLSAKYSATVKVHGGGKEGQLDATVLGIARALTEIKTDFIKPLRDAGLMTRDSRTRQRRMVGTGGKSRRRKQSPKR